jgi:Rieske Fe-S protein
MNRKEFIKNGCAACLSVTAVASVFAGCTATKYITGTLTRDGLIIDKDQFRIKEKGSTAYRSFIMVRNDALLYPVCVYRFNENEYSALWMQCTHQGSELQASGDRVQCPAHGSEFTNRGLVRNGPADRDLRTFPVTVNNHELFIDMRKQS